MQLADLFDPATQTQLQRWVDQALDFLDRLQWPTLEDFHVWGELHPDAVLLGGLFLGLVCLVLGMGWWVSRIPVASQSVAEHKDEEAQVGELKVSKLPDLELRLGISRADLAEVGLPLMTPQPVPKSGPISPRMTSLEELSNDHLMIIARYCIWKGDSDGALDAVTPIMFRGDAQQQRAALALLEGR